MCEITEILSVTNQQIRRDNNIQLNVHILQVTKEDEL